MQPTRWGAVASLALLGWGCGEKAPATSDRSGPQATTSTRASTSAAPTTSSGPAVAAPPPLASLTLTLHCDEAGAVLRRLETRVEGATGHVVVKEDDALAGEATLAAGDLAELAAVLAGPAYATFRAGDMQIPPGRVGEATTCRLTLEGGGFRDEKSWSSLAEPTREVAKGKYELESAIDKLRRRAVEALFGGPCTRDADCHLASGANCTCAAAGPPPEAGNVSRCTAHPCKDDDEARCDAGRQRCIVRKKKAK